MSGCSLSGISLNGSDIGGFAGPAPDPELFIRWIWCGILLPRFSIHSANNDNTVTEPWMYPEIMEHVQSAFRLRIALLPYLYSLGAHSHRTGEPILRPMIYEFPNDKNLLQEDVNFMLGDSLLAACVVNQGETTRNVYLPEGEIFYDFYTRKCYSGGQTISVPAPWNQTPLFQRGGSILPLQQNNTIHLWICAEKPCAFTLYEDDGISNNYKNNQYCATELKATREQDLVILESNRTGSYVPNERIHFHIQCTNIAPVEVYWDHLKLPQILDEERFESAESGWHYYHSTKVCTIKCGNGRNLSKLLLNFGKFDLIRMDN